MLQSIRLFIFFNLFFVFVRGQSYQSIFRHYTINDGLSQTTVYAICQDSLGYMWFGTLDGLNKFDGYKFKVYRYNHKDSNSITDNIISVLYVDKNKELWVGTFSKGLSKYNYAKDNFENFIYSQGCVNCPNNNTIRALIQDDEGYLWIGSNNGLNRFDIAKKQFQNYNHCLPKENQQSTIIYSIVFDYNQIMWIGTNKGLMKLNKSLNKFEPVVFKKNLQANVLGLAFDKQNRLWIATTKGIFAINPQTYESIDYIDKVLQSPFYRATYTNCIYIDSEDNIWFGTDVKGLFQYIPYKDQWQVYQHEAYNTKSLGNNRIWSIFEDKNKKMWFGTDVAGVDCFSPHEVYFTHICKHPLQEDYLSDNNIWSFCEDEKGNVYIGTDMGGLNIFNPQTNKFSYLRANNGQKSITSDYVRCLLKDNEGNIWIGTNKGVNVLTKTGNIKQYKYAKNNHNSLACDIVRVIFQDSKQNIWLGTEIGLSRYNPVKDNFDNFYINPSDTLIVRNNRIWALCESSDGNLWVGTCGTGLYKFNLKKCNFEYYFDSLNIKKNHLSEIIRCIYEDNKKNLWLGTSNGLVKINLNTNNVKCFYEEDGLPNNLIYGILPDNNGNLWLSTNYGISRFNTTSEQFKNYTIIDGLQNNEFNQGAYFKSKSGKMYFGGINGYNVFYPEKIEAPTVFPKVTITDFKIFNKSIPISNDGILKKHISLVDKIKISHRDNVISLEFSALNFSSPAHNYYYYKLEGFDKEWVYAGNTNMVTYTNLDPKKYIFKVKCSNNNLVWGDDYTSLQIVVTPPFYKTYWFLLIIVLLIIFGVVFYIKLRILLLKRRNKILTKLVELRTSQIAEQNVKILEQKEEIAAQKDKIEKQLHDLKNAYSELEKLNFVVSKTDNAVIICNSEGLIEWTNQAFIKYFEGYIFNLDKYIGKSIKNLFNSAEIEKLIDEFFQKKETITFSFTFAGKNKETKNIQFTLTYVYNEDLNYSNIIAVASDFTEIKRTLDELNQLKAITAAERVKMDFLANMSHEIRTPLNAILGFTDLLKEELKNTKSKEYLDIISNNAVALLKLITDILEIAKSDVDNKLSSLSAINIREVIDEILSIYQLELLRKQIFVDFEKNEDFPDYIIFDNSRLRQILLNILGNAIKFTEKGRILIRLSANNVDKTLGNFDLMIEIIDTGIGMDAEMKQKIFGLFQQADSGISRRYDGLGIGLSITKKLIDALGGTIIIESELNKGTSVSLIFKDVKIIDNTNIDAGEKFFEKNKEEKILNQNQLFQLLATDISQVDIPFNKEKHALIVKCFEEEIEDELIYIKKSAKINQIKVLAQKIMDNPLFDDIILLKKLSEQLYKEAEFFNVRNIHLILDKIEEIIIFIKKIQ